MATQSRRFWGWYFCDWASQPYNTLLLTFIFAPYITSIMGNGSAAQTVWGYGIGLSGLVIALLSPLLGAIADRTGRRGSAGGGRQRRRTTPGARTDSKARR